MTCQRLEGIIFFIHPVFEIKVMIVFAEQFFEIVLILFWNKYFTRIKILQQLVNIFFVALRG
ncbi:hypothetical protein D3C86_688190 [compost metagenome]